MTFRICASTYLITVCLTICALVSCSKNPGGSAERLMSVSATSLEFSSWAGHHPDPAQIRVVVKVDGEGTIDWTATANADWLRLGPPGSDTIFVTVLSDTLPAGDYADTITVSTPTATNSPLQIGVSLTVRNRIIVSQNSLVFVGLGGGDNPEPQTFIVSDYEGQDVTYEATTSVAWLGLEDATGTVPGTVTVIPEISGLAAGQYVGEIVISSPDLPESQATVHCELNLSSWTGLYLGDGTAGVDLEGVQFIDSLVGWASGWTPWGYNEHSGRVYRTVDGGETWTTVLEAIGTKFGRVAVQDADRCWVAGSSAWVEYSDNGGSDWVKSENLPLDSALNLIQIVFIGSLDGWIAGHLGTIMHTENNGIDWSLQTTPTAHNLSDICFFDNRTGWAVGNHGTILHTTNAGITWTAQDPGTLTDLRSVWFVDPLVGWVVGSQGLVRHTEDGGASWNPIDIGTDSYLRGVYFSSPMYGWVVGSGGEIRHTRNGGLSWLAQPTGLTEGLSCVYFHNDNMGWVVGTAGTVLKTASGGF